VRKLRKKRCDSIQGDVNGFSTFGVSIVLVTSNKPLQVTLQVISIRKVRDEMNLRMLTTLNNTLKMLTVSSACWKISLDCFAIESALESASLLVKAAVTLPGVCVVDGEILLHAPMEIS
jgi:hypothetical protein